MAGSLSQQPNWKQAQVHEMVMSGKKLVISLPGNISADIPQQFESNLNIYDSTLYGDWKRYEAAKVWWDYKKRVLLVMSELLGTLELRIAIYMAPNMTSNSNLNLLEQGGLKLGMQQLMQQLMREAYPEPENADQVPQDFEQVKINSVDWVKYVKKSKGSTSDKLCYAVVLTGDRLLEISFRMIETMGRGDAVLYVQAQSDIEQIMNSVKVAE